MIYGRFTLMCFYFIPTDSLHRVQKMTRSRARDVEFLKAKLDSLGDEWRTAPDPMDVKEEGEE